VRCPMSTASQTKSSAKKRTKSRAKRRAKSSAKRHAIERIAHTPLGPLPESFFSGNRRLRRAKLSAELAKQYAAYVSTRDDDEGQIRRREATLFALGAFIHWALAEGIPPQHLLPLIGLGADLGDLLLGRHPKSLKPIQRREGKRGNPGRTLKDVAIRAYACAAIDVLIRNPGEPIKTIQQEEAGVARMIGMEVGALRSWRKALMAGKKDPQAYRIYEAAMSECQQQPNPRKAAHNLLASIWKR
jgi:hypothetical protein